EGEQMVPLALPPIDILGYGPIAEDLEAGRVGLVWGGGAGVADSPEKVPAKTAGEGQSVSVSMGVMDLVWKAGKEGGNGSPYFVPGHEGVRAFGDLTKRNVKVTVLTNSLGSNDAPIVHTGYSRYRVDLLKAGVDLYELSPTRIQKNERLMLPGMSLGRL